MSEDQSLIHFLDQPMPLPTDLKEKTFDRIDKIFEQAFSDKDPMVAFNAGTQLIQVGSLSGLALAKMAYMLNRFWPGFEVEEDFFDLAFEMWGKSRTYLERLISIWGNYAAGEMPEVLMNRPIKDQQAIAKMLDQGFFPEGDQWNKIINSPDNVTLLAEIRDIKGTAPRRNSRSTILLKRSGDIVAYVENEPVFLGWLNVHDMDKPVIERLITQIISLTGMKRE